MMCHIFSSANTFGAKQFTALHKELVALHKFSPTLPKIWAVVAEKGILQNPTWCPFKIKK
jgi:hypothetical protein